MPYAFAPRQPSRTGQGRSLSIPTTDWMGLKFDEFSQGTIFNKISRFTEERVWENGAILKPELANETFGIPGYLKFEEPVSIQRARLMQERKQAELRRLAYLQAADHSAFSLKAALGLGAGMAGAVSNPLDFAATFFPFVGAGSKASGIAKMGHFGRAAEAARMGGSRLQALADRGLLGSVDDLAALNRFPHFSASVINASLGNAIVEIPVLIQNTRDQAIYGPEDSALNILLGGAVGGAFHVGGVAISKLFAKTAETHSRLAPETKELMLQKAANDMLEGSPVSVEGIARTDRDAILRDIQFDEMAARQAALERVGVLPEEAKARSIIDGLNRKQASALDLLDMARTRSKSANAPDAAIAARLLDRFKSGERGVDMFKQLAELFDVRYNPLAPTVQERLKADLLSGGVDRIAGESTAAAFKRARRELRELERAIERISEDISIATKGKDPQVKPFVPKPDDLLAERLKLNRDSLLDQRAKLVREIEEARERISAEVGAATRSLTPEEIEAHSSLVAMDAPRDFEARADAARLEAIADTVREARVKELIEAERKKITESLENRMPVELKAEIVKAIEDGKMLTDEEAKALTKDVTDESGMAAIRESIASLEQDLKAVDPGDQVGRIIQSELDKIQHGQDVVERFLDRIKIETNSGQLHAFGLLPSVWNQLIEVVRLAYRGGKAIGDAVDDGMKWLRSVSDTANESKIREAIGDVIKSEKAKSTRPDEMVSELGTAVSYAEANMLSHAYGAYHPTKGTQLSPENFGSATDRRRISTIRHEDGHKVWETLSQSERLDAKKAWDDLPEIEKEEIRRRYPADYEASPLDNDWVEEMFAEATSSHMWGWDDMVPGRVRDILVRHGVPVIGEWSGGAWVYKSGVADESLLPFADSMKKAYDVAADCLLKTTI